MAKRKKNNPLQILFIFWQLGRRYPPIFLLLILAGGSWYSYELYYARPRMVYMGLPEAHNWKQPFTWTRIFRNHGFIVGYSDLRGNPLWVCYQLRPIPNSAPSYKRPQRFYADWRNLTHITHDTYDHSGYDRGHMAPNYAISRLYGRSAQLDTFLMTNVTPQTANLNEKLWERLEEVEIDYFAKQFGTVWVFTGPIFNNKTKRLRSSFRVEIPDSFYKIYLAPPAKKGQLPRMLAFIMPQQVRGNEPLNRFIVSVDEVEHRTGFDFFHKLEDISEEKLESAIDSNPWNLKAISRLPARY
jgi:endonuclease G